ncbi:MAG: hypothetical protein ACYCOR_19865 [Acidobacteriaceae bacterium]
MIVPWSGHGPVRPNVPFVIVPPLTVAVMVNTGPPFGTAEPRVRFPLSSSVPVKESLNSANGPPQHPLALQSCGKGNCTHAVPETALPTEARATPIGTMGPPLNIGVPLLVSVSSQFPEMPAGVTGPVNLPPLPQPVVPPVIKQRKKSPRRSFCQPRAPTKSIPANT